MKKVVNFNSLPALVRQLLTRMHYTNSHDFFKSEDIVIKEIIENIDWRKATDVERISFANYLYPKGTKFHYHNKPYLSPRIVSGEGFVCNVVGNIYDIGNSYFVYEENTNKWATIINDKIEVEDSVDWIKSTKEKMDGMVKDKYINCIDPLQPEWRNPTRAEIEKLLDSTQLDEPKAGDLVEGSNDESKGKSWFGPLHFTGGKLITGEFICEIKTDENDVHTPDLRYFKRIRKYNPNGHLENIVEMFMTKTNVPKGEYKRIYKGNQIKKLLVDFGLYAMLE